MSGSDRTHKGFHHLTPKVPQVGSLPSENSADAREPRRALVKENFLGEPRGGEGCAPRMVTLPNFGNNAGAETTPNFRENF